MNKTKIDWVKNPDGTQGYIWNPITGCLNNCTYCYARRLANTRLKGTYLANNILAQDYSGNHVTDNPFTDPFYPRFWEDKECDPIRRNIYKGKAHKARGIFVCDMSDLFGIGIPEEWTKRILTTIQCCPIDRFYLLTKQPQNLAKFKFPDNCYVGVTATDDIILRDTMVYFKRVVAKVKFISFEPLLYWTDYYKGILTKSNSLGERWLKESGINWVIIGAQTKPHKPPKIEWVREIVEACDKAGIPVFLKKNLESLWTLENRCEPFFKFSRLTPGATEVGKLRQEMPTKIA